MTGAEYGDFRGLKELGVDTSGYESQQERQRALDDALLRAQYGDYSGLQALGVDTSGYETEQESKNNHDLFLPLISDAKSEIEVLDIIYSLTGDRILAERYAEYWRNMN